MVVRFQADHGQADRAVDAIFTHFARRGVSFLWLLHPSATPARLPDLLRGRGFEQGQRGAYGVWRLASGVSE